MCAPSDYNLRTIHREPSRYEVALRLCLVFGTVMLAISIGSGNLVFPQSESEIPLDRYMLSFRVIDAEYSRELDRLVMVSSTPNQLHIYDPNTGRDVGIDLPLAPSCVSVGPDGRSAVVGHDAWLSYVDLGNTTLEGTFPISIDVLDVVLAGNGYIYAFPRRDQWSNIHCLEIATQEETLSIGFSIYAGTLAKLHPSGSAIYGADNGIYPTDLEKYSITDGTAKYLYDSPYHGDYGVCGNLWMSEDGLRIFTRCGNVFRSSTIQAQDMIYNGKLSELDMVAWADDSASAGMVIAIPYTSYYSSTDEDTRIQIYDYQFLSFEQSVELPEFEVNNNSYLGHGRYAFFNRDSTMFHVIVQADESSGMLFDFAVVTYPLDTLSPKMHANELYFAHFANGDDFLSNLILTNPSRTKTASGDVCFFDDNGNRLPISINGEEPAVSFPFTLPPMGRVSLSTDGQGSLAPGSARIYASDPVGGVLKFTYPGLGIAGVGASEILTGFVTPVRSSESAGYSTGIAIAATADVSLSLSLRDSDGELVAGGQEILQLPSNGHIARFLGQLFPSADISEFEGTLEVVSTDAGFVMGTAIEIGSKPGEFTTLPVTPIMK